MTYKVKNEKTEKHIYRVIILVDEIKVIWLYKLLLFIHINALKPHEYNIYNTFPKDVIIMIFFSSPDQCIIAVTV